MTVENRLLGIFAPDANVEFIAAELGRVGVARSAITIAARDSKYARALAERIGARFAEADAVLQPIPPARARFLAQRLASGGTLLGVSDASEDVVHILHREGGDLGSADTAQDGDAEYYRSVVPLRSEKPDVQVYTVVDSVVEIHREVVTERVTFAIPLKRETLVIVRRDPNGDSVEEQRIELRHEEASVSKSTIVTSVVDVRRELVEERRVVDVELRRERPVITGDVHATRPLEQQH